MGTFLSDTGILKELKADHREIQSLCKKLKKADDPSSADARANFEKLREKVISHSKAEEAVFYRLLKKKAQEDSNDELKDLVLEGFEEHHVVDRLLKELTDLDPSNERWKAKMSVLSELLDHHIEEEEDEMFDEAKSELEKDELRALGPRFKEVEAERAESLR